MLSVNSTYDELKPHIGHETALIYSGSRSDPDAISIECADCDEVLLQRERPEPLKKFAVRKTRPIEMYVGKVSPQEWHTIDVDIPVDTPETGIEVAAKAALEIILANGKVDAAFFGVYFIPDLTDLSDDLDEEDYEPDKDAEDSAG